MNENTVVESAEKFDIDLVLLFSIQLDTKRYLSNAPLKKTFKNCRRLVHVAR